MPYVSKNLSRVFDGAGGPIGFGLWIYDTTDATGDIDTAGYISDALTKGMEKGDVVYIRIWTTAIPANNAQKVTAAGTACVLSAMGQYVVMGITTAGAADLAATTALTVTNSD
jgi:hypothetical protein